MSFLIERDGSVVNIELLNGLGYGCDEEVINIIKHAPRWHPAIDNGRPIAITEIVSVEFKLTDK